MIISSTVSTRRKINQTMWIKNFMKKERGFSLIEKFRRLGKTQNSKMFTYNLHTKAVKSKNIYRIPRITYIADKSFFHSFHCRVGKSEAQNSTSPDVCLI